MAQIRSFYVTGDPLLDRYLADIAMRLDALEGIRPALDAGFLKLTAAKQIETSTTIEVLDENDEYIHKME